MKIEIGDKADCVFLQGVAAKHRPFDVDVDGGVHEMHQQKASFNTLWSQLADGGLYIMEDTHSSYWPGFGGGFQEKNIFIDYLKDLVDKMHSWYTDQDDIFPFHPIARELSSVRFYDLMVSLKKTSRKKRQNSYVHQWCDYGIAQNCSGMEPKISFLAVCSGGLDGCAEMRM